MTPVDVFIVLSVIVILIGLNGLYVAAEFSAVSASKARLSQMAAEGNQRAVQAVEIIDNPQGLDDFIAACQLGITLTSLILGFYGQARLTVGLEAFLVRMADDFAFINQLTPESMATIGVLFMLTIVAVLLGELVPKNLGVQMPERLLLLTISSMIVSLKLFRPLIWFFNGSGALILRLFGASAMSEHAHVHSPEEIQILVEESSEGGVLDNDERKLLINTLRLRAVTARKVMIPRNRMLTADVNLPLEVLLEKLARSRYSRLPLHEGTIDKIVGFVHLKDLLRLIHQPDSPLLEVDKLGPDEQHGETPKEITVRDVMRPVVFLPETIRVDGILESMQHDQNYIVIVADEYGGTSGMITIEDLFEEIIGEFYDEFDQNRQLVHIGAENRLFVNGDIQVDDLNEWLQFNLPEEDADTIGGLVFSLRGKLPEKGDVVSVHARGARPENDDEQHSNHTDTDNGSSHGQVESETNGEPHHAEGANESDTEENEGSTSLLNKIAHGFLDESELIEPEGIIDIKVEKMQDNSVREVSFQISESEIELLHKHEIF